MTFAELCRNVRVSRRSEQRRQPVLVGGNVIQDCAWLDVSWPANENGPPPAPLPIGILLATIRSDPGIWPAVVVRAVVGRVHHDRVVGDAERLEFVQHPANVLIMSDHDVVVVALTAFAFVLLGTVGPEVHGSRVVPEEEWPLLRMHSVYEV